MLKIKQTQTTFLKGIHMGINAFCIELSDDGYEEDTLKMAEAAASFSFVLIYGEEPFKHSKDVSELCKETQKLNPHTHIIIFTNGMIRPTNMNSIRNIEYIINCKLKQSGLKFDERINEIAWNWLAKAGGKFIFRVCQPDDFEEINIIISALTIHKSQIYIDICGGDYNEIAFLILNKGYNLCFSFEGEIYHAPEE